MEMIALLYSGDATPHLQRQIYDQTSPLHLFTASLNQQQLLDACRTAMQSGTTKTPGIGSPATTRV